MARTLRADPMSCWFAEHLHGIGPCDGRLDPCHLIKRQTIKREVGLRDAWDPRVVVPGCRRHHGMLDDSRTLRIPRHALPAGVEEFAEEHNLVWWLRREYGLKASP